ncbi:hypothetical protein Ddye_002302 [Dipteronia dyeriana]|uniref:Uncharacterized protein n=1 Tax=Dipteronia dyeriana TaxID=168575 RepID=A0AAD9XRH3_9ROSI|nr:hypothetical protein Ddye_002302 [Dipteronia dyeriana]
MNMDELYGLHSTVDYSSMQHTDENNLMVGNTTTSSTVWTNVYDHHHISSSSSSTPPQVVTTFNPVVVYGSQQFGSGSSGLSDAASMVAQLQTNNNNSNTSEEAEVSSAIRARIASHPLYPKLLQSYIDCHKVGSPPEMTDVLNEIIRSSESDVNKRSAVVSGCLGADPELDEFMETYCDILNKYKSDLSKPFDEATTFLNSMETQLSNLCNGGVSRSYGSAVEGGGGGGGSSDDEEEELSGGGETEEVHEECIIRADVDRELKDKLIRKYGGYISSLKNEFSKKKKKGKLPKQARQALFEWWNIHYRWPYPTEADKIALAESTGLDQKQINNWFINQRKRHWKPSDNMQLSVMETLYGGGTV